MSAVDRQHFITGWTDILGRQDWNHLGDFVHEDAVFEFPQSRGDLSRG